MQLNYSGILIVMLSAMAGYMGNYLIIRSSLIHPSTNRVVNIYMDSAEFKFKEISPDSLNSWKGNPVKEVVMDKSEILFHENPHLLIWSTIMLILMAIEYGALPVFIWQMKKLSQEFALVKSQLLRAFLFTLTIMGFIIFANSMFEGYIMGPKLIDKFHVLLQHGYILSLINLQVFVLQAPALLLIFLSPAASERIRRTFDLNYNDWKKEEIDKAVMQFRNLQQVLSGSVLFLAVTVIFSVLTTSALRQSMLAVLDVDSFNFFPREISYVYGLGLSLFLGVAYLPSYFYLKLKSAELKERIILMNSVNGSDPDDKWKEKTLEDLEINSTPVQNLRVLLTVLSPLITSVVTELRLFK